MKKLVSIKGVIDNIRLSVNTPSPPGISVGPVKLEQDLVETLLPHQFTAESTLRHGFPFKAISMAFDPIQRLLAIGSRSGVVRIFGRPGVDLELVHEGNVQVLQILFIINSGKLITACTDDSINLWDIRKKEPELVQSLMMKKERLTVMSLEFQDKWLYLGTERGNVYIMNVESFSLSGYSVSWNKCIDPLQKNHPGAVACIGVNPTDPGKLLIGYGTGLICLWDLALKKAEQRYIHNQRLCSFSWHMEGRQFVCSYGDGSLLTWNIKPQVNNKPQTVQFVHGKRNKDTSKMEPCEAIEKVVWKTNRTSGESFFVFSGGLPKDVTGVAPSITVMQGKSTTLLEMEYCVLDFLLVTDSPYSADYQEPEAVIVMLANDLVAIDCKSPGYPCFKNPYAMDFNESPVTCCSYLVDCPSDLIPLLYLVGSKAKKEGSSRGFSSGEWPVCGGTDTGAESCSYTELVITGHADGTIKFWDSSSTSMQALYRVKTSKYFERVKKPDGSSVEGIDDDPYAICQICMRSETRELAVAGATGQIVFFKFRKKETVTEPKSMDIPIVYEVSPFAQQPKNNNTENGSPHTQQQHFEFPMPRPTLNVASQSSSYTDPVDGFNFDKPQYEYFCPLRVRAGSQRKTPGYHAELICFTPWVNNEAPSPISCLTLSKTFGLMAYGNGSGLVIIDLLQNVCLLNMGTADLYGSLDPFQRLPKSPKPFGDLASADIVRVDLSNYSQVNETGGSNNLPTPQAGGRVKSPDCRRLQKANSSADENSSLSKSRSSSLNSLEGAIAGEGVCAVHLVDSFPTKNDYTLCECLYVGTTLGSLIGIVINLPERGEARLSEPVVVSPSGSLFRLRGAVLTMCFLDSSSSGGGAQIRGGDALENVRLPAKHASPSAGASAQGSQDGSPSAHAALTGDQQVVVVCTEKMAAVFAIPSQRQMYSQTITESSTVVCAEIINFGGSRYTPCLVAYTAEGFVKAYSLPSLRPMLDVYLVASTPMVKHTMSFSNFGHGLFLCSPTEVQKFSVSSDFMRQFPDMKGTLFQDGLPMPEPPKQSFFKGIFGGGPKPLDREELFGEQAGKASAGTATHVPGANMQAAQSKSISTTNEVAKAKMAFIERGQKLNDLEDRTEAMANEAKQYASNAHAMLQQAKSKKWYQI